LALRLHSQRTCFTAAVGLSAVIQISPGAAAAGPATHEPSLPRVSSPLFFHLTPFLGWPLRSVGGSPWCRAPVKTRDFSFRNKTQGSKTAGAGARAHFLASAPMPGVGPQLWHRICCLPSTTLEVCTSVVVPGLCNSGSHGQRHRADTRRAKLEARYCTNTLGTGTVRTEYYSVTQMCSIPGRHLLLCAISERSRLTFGTWCSAPHLARWRGHLLCRQCQSFYCMWDVHHTSMVPSISRKVKDGDGRMISQHDILHCTFPKMMLTCVQWRSASDLERQCGSRSPVAAAPDGRVAGFLDLAVFVPVTHASSCCHICTTYHMQ